MTASKITNRLRSALLWLPAALLAAALVVVVIFRAFRRGWTRARQLRAAHAPVKGVV